MTPGIGESRAAPAVARGLVATTRKVVRRPQFWFATIWLVPTVIWYSLFLFFPILRGFWLAVVDYNITNPAASPFVGLDNLRKLLLNPLLFVSLKNTVLLGALQFAIILPLALLVSTCLVNLTRGTASYQGVIFLPVVVSLVAVSLLFRMLMDPELGQFNQVLRALHLPTFKWLSSSDSALVSIAIIDIWKGLGFYVVLLTAGMLNIPSELYEAARVDGTNEWQRFWYMTLPLLRHTLVLVMIILAIGSLQVYTGPFVLTSGGPGYSTYVFNMLIVDEAFTNLRFGTAAVAALVQFGLVFIVSLVQLKLIRPRWSY
ncbi:MAG TPA: sugar ABC transporter permease [Chloroflexota bacterium]|jgi:ABC-type sugar transport system permease subunit|nr:sugar ABC transporter permease [Chloroflexota bacterium]